MKRLERVARMLGRGLAIAGLAMIYLSLLMSLLQITAPRESVLKAGFILAIVGCILLVGALARPQDGKKGRVAVEATLGILCVPPGVVAGFLAHGDEVGPQASWIAITILFLGSAVALVVQAAQAKQASERWRNPDQWE